MEKIKEKYYNTNSIGTDEVGTGDYFGPIIITATYIEKKNIPFLEKLNLKESKLTTNQEILRKVPMFLTKIKFKTIILTNEQYNKYYSKAFNLNKIKAILHNQAIHLLKKEITSYEHIIVDKFTSEELYFKYLTNNKNIEKDISFFIKAETIHLAVTCSSLISKFYYILEMNKLNYKLKTKLPYGSNKKAKLIKEKIAKEHGINTLKVVAKINFQ